MEPNTDQGGSMELVTAATASHILGVSSMTIQRWIASGRLAASRVTYGSRTLHVMCRADVERLAEELAAKRAAVA
jgi:excisionase family DNA binding protein